MGDSKLTGYTDADWANNRSNCCSVSRYAFLFSGGAMSWMSKQQSTITTSSTHAEYITAAKELVWLCHLLTNLQEEVSGPTVLHINNHAADLLTRNPVNHAVTKHINIQYHYIRECIVDRSLKLKLIGTNDMAADVLTKSVVHTKHECFCLMLSMEMLS